jgi:hypothetical protein
VFAKHGIFPETALAHPVGPLIQTNSKSDDTVSHFETRDTTSHLDNLSSHVGAQDDRQLGPRDDEIGGFLDDPVVRVDRYSNVLYNHFILARRCVCRGSQFQWCMFSDQKGSLV